MNFQTAKTSEKLKFLARMLETKLADQFDQNSIKNCVVGLGARLKSNGQLADYEVGSVMWIFPDKYGVTETETDALFCATYSGLDIDEPDLLMVDDRDRTDYSKVTLPDVVRVLRKLGNKYMRAGN